MSGQDQELVGSYDVAVVEQTRTPRVTESDPEPSRSGRVRLYSRGPDGKRRRLPVATRDNSAELRVRLSNADARLFERIADHIDENFSTIVRNMIREKAAELFGDQPDKEDLEP